MTEPEDAGVGKKRNARSGIQVHVCEMQVTKFPINETVQTVSVVSLFNWN